MSTAVTHDYIPGFYIGDRPKVVTSRFEHEDSYTLERYLATDGYKGLRSALARPANEIHDEVKNATVLGRGGAGFPTWMKWSFTKQVETKDDKYFVCNADEGDPGAYMDRSTLEGDPHSVLEGMIIGAYTIQATSGVIYCRAEYPLAIKRLNIAIEQAQKKGYLGKNIFGVKGFDFDIYIKEGAGAFVCGEETALIHSLEGNRGEPTKKPPFPSVSPGFAYLLSVSPP